jgi:hypothetical protein
MTGSPATTGGAGGYLQQLISMQNNPNLQLAQQLGGVAPQAGAAQPQQSPPGAGQMNMPPPTAAPGGGTNMTLDPGTLMAAMAQWQQMQKLAQQRAAQQAPGGQQGGQQRPGGGNIAELQRILQQFNSQR